MNLRSFALAAALAVVPALFSTPVHAQTCQPGLSEALAGPNGPSYQTLFAYLGPNAVNLTYLTALTVDQPSYQNLLNLANALAAITPGGGRVVVTLPDGTVVVDTNRNDGPGDPKNNSYANFIAKTINENHNSRIAILAPQLYPCGFGVETKRSSSTGQKENYVAMRLGNHLDNAGTARLSRVE